MRRERFGPTGEVGKKQIDAVEKEAKLISSATALTLLSALVLAGVLLYSTVMYALSILREPSHHWASLTPLPGKAEETQSFTQVRVSLLP